MAIAAGSRLGPYEVVAPLGAGGMGEVFRGRDTRLGRDVAIKILPGGFAQTEESRARFEREAKTISSLNHPHICTLFDVGDENGTHFLVMELIEGESLADRLQKGPLPSDQVLRYGAQIADGLHRAHRHAIVHRDLKPGNIMLTRSGAKLLDFGLAHASTRAPVDSLSDSPTREKPLTAEGTIVGTFQYMAPEQLEGKEVDARTDVFALGAVLYEMATGRRAFEGTSKTTLIAAIVSSQPPSISSLQRMMPPALDHVVQKCLEKDPDDRWQSAYDVAEELTWISQAGSQAGVAAPIIARRRVRERAAWALAALLGAITLALLIGTLGRAPRPAPLIRATLSPPAGAALVPFDELGIALSPDGRRLAFVAYGGDGGKQIWIRDLSSMTAKLVGETSGAWYPFWSPDGAHLAFFANGKLKKIDLRGGSPQVLADAPSGRGGSWSREGVILFAPNIRSPIHSISAAGGMPKPVTRFDPERETTHRWPQFLPDGRHFLYVSRARITGKPEVGRLMLASLDSPEASVLVEDASNAAYVEPGYLIYGRSANLIAQRFDAKRLRLEGEPSPITDEKLSYWEAKNLVIFAASDDGTIVYLPESVRRSVLRWYDRTGRPLEAIGEPGFQSDPRLSPDAKKIAVIRGEPQPGKQDIWIHDLEYGRAYRLTLRSGLYGLPRWSRDGSRLMFICSPKGVQDLCVKTLGDAGDVQLLHESLNWKTACAWTPDGAAVVFAEQNPETNDDLWILPLGEKKEPQVLLRTPFDETLAELSPDGRWMAYLSNETGRVEVYLRAATGASQQWQLSSSGGARPRWRRDGKEILFAATDGNVIAVPIETQPVLRPGTPRALFTLPERPDRDTPILEDVSPDGERFLLNIPVESRTGVGFHAIFHWTSALSR